MGFVLDGFGESLHDNLGGRFDVVGFDPRGIGASDPLHCFDSEDELSAFLSAVPLFPYERAQYRPFYKHFASLAGRCLSRGETIAAHMSTADVVRDLDLLRQAVGDRRLTYLGFSYGSYIGTTYANLFSRNIRALVIDGVLDPRLWSSGWQIRSDRVATQEEFDEFLRLCREAGPACAFGAGRHTAKRWETLARSVERKPIDLGDGFLYTYDFLIGDATGAMYAPEIWGGPDGYGAFLDLLADAALGDQSAKSSPSRPAASSFAGRSNSRGGLRERLRRLLRQPVRRHRVPRQLRGVPDHRRVCAGRIAVRPVLVVVQQRLHRLAGGGGSLRRPVGDPHVEARPRRGQLLRRRHRLHRGAGGQPAAREQPSPELRRLGAHGLRPQRLHDGARRRVPRQRHAAAGGDGVSGQPESVPLAAGRPAAQSDHVAGAPPVWLLRPEP